MQWYSVILLRRKGCSWHYTAFLVEGCLSVLQTQYLETQNCMLTRVILRVAQQLRRPQECQSNGDIVDHVPPPAIQPDLVMFTGSHTPCAATQPPARSRNKSRTACSDGACQQTYGTSTAALLSSALRGLATSCKVSSACELI